MVLTSAAVIIVAATTEKAISIALNTKLESVFMLFVIVVIIVAYLVPSPRHWDKVVIRIIKCAQTLESLALLRY